MSQPVTNFVMSSSNSIRRTTRLMETFLCMEVKQPGKVIKLDLNSYVQEVLIEHKPLRLISRKALHLKRVLMTPGVVIINQDSPIVPDHKQKNYPSFLT